MRLPDFLIIGAMKAGTTTLYYDLLDNPAVYMPSTKEPGNLLTDEVGTPRGRRAYGQLFKSARSDQICGEASTTYSKLPDYEGVPQRAVRELGRDLKVIYLVREPVARIMSQHHHERSGARISCGIDEAVRRFPRFIDYSRYAKQITPWIETLGTEQVRIVRFESYVSDRLATVNDLSRFLGVTPHSERIDTEAVHNRSGGKPVREGPFEIVRSTAIYRRLLRPLLNPKARDSLRRFLLPKAPDRPETPSSDTIRYIADELADDLQRLAGLMGLDGQPWNLGEGRAMASSVAPSGPRESKG